MNTSFSMTKKNRIFLFLFMLIALCGISGCGSDTKTTGEEKVKQESVQSSSLRDTKKEKDAIKNTISYSRYKLKNVSVSEQTNNSYQIIGDMEIPQKNESMARDMSISAIKEIFQDNTGEDYDIESIAITAIHHNAPIGIYRFTSAKYSTSGNDEYSAMINGKQEILK